MTFKYLLIREKLNDKYCFFVLGIKLATLVSNYEQFGN